MTVSELKKQQQEEQLVQAATRVEELLIDTQAYAQKLRDATQANFHLGAELTATKAVLSRYEQTLQKIAVSQQQDAGKEGGQRRGSGDNQELPFGLDK